MPHLGWRLLRAVETLHWRVDPKIELRSSKKASKEQIKFDHKKRENFSADKKSAVVRESKKREVH